MREKERESEPLPALWPLELLWSFLLLEAKLSSMLGHSSSVTLTYNSVVWVNNISNQIIFPAASSSILDVNSEKFFDKS